ncbi:MAG TPA: ABC transporter permease [Chloroflexota bacterium]|jgi:peptide/nickel transport system permease protein
MRVEYLVRRLILFFVVVWVAATINFVLPRLSGGNAIRNQLTQQAASGGYVQGNIDAMVAEFDKEFGLDKPLWQQYLSYMWDIAHFEFGFSMASYPMRVSTLMANALPWTLALLGLSTAIAFSLGMFLGGLMAWPRTPRWIVNVLLPPFLTLSAVPYYMLGLVLLWVLAFQTHWFPIFGAYTPGVIPDWSDPEFLKDVASHMVLPALSIVLSALGFWALGMRAMMVTVQNDDFVQFAEAKGLRGRTVFFRYAGRNALLPQVTALGLTIGHILSGALLVEIVFSYPGIGNVLYRSIKAYDYFAIEGIVFGVIVSITVATLVLDLVYPKIDPRISYAKS